MSVDIITRKHVFFILTLFGVYYVMSSSLTINGANAPVMMAHYAITAAQQGLIMTMLSVGRLGGGIYFGLRGERYNKINALLFGMIILCLTNFAIGFSPVYTLLLVIAFVSGVGVACLDIMVNSVVSDVYPKHKRTFLSFINAFFSVGALLAPVIVSLTAHPSAPSTFNRPFQVICVIAVIILALVLINGKKVMPDTPYIDMESRRKQASQNPGEIFKTKIAWVFLVVGVLYFNFMFAIAVWLPSFAIQSKGVDFHTAEIMVTAFFAGMLPMRFLGPFLFKKLSPQFIFCVFGCASALCMLAALFTTNTAAIFVLVFFCGFLQGFSVPLFVVMCTNAFPGRTASASSLLAISGGTGSLLAPLWVGVISAYTGFLTPLIMACAILIVAACLIQLTKKV